jgi:hypothetical protein
MLVFEECSSLTAITIPDSVTWISDGAFYGCSSLTAITIPDSVKSIGNLPSTYGAFSGCSSLTAITIPDSVTTLHYSAFSGCTSLAAITIPDSVMTIEDYAFYGCSALTRLSLSPAVSIGHDCFSNCTALISAAAAQNMSTVPALLHSRWHRILERVTVLVCLKTLFTDQKKRKRQDGSEAQTLGVTATSKRLPKVMWRVILEFL